MSARSEEVELEDRRISFVEDEEPLLPTANSGDRKVEIGSWPLACLLLQHLSRSAPFMVINVIETEMQYAQYWRFRICYFPILYAFTRTYGVS